MKNRVQQIHIVGEYAKKMLEDYAGAVQFVDDYSGLISPLFSAGISRSAAA
jgi:ATP-dependent DNA helicase RecQ